MDFSKVNVDDFLVSVPSHTSGPDDRQNWKQESTCSIERSFPQVAPDQVANQPICYQ